MIKAIISITKLLEAKNLVGLSTKEAGIEPSSKSSMLLDAILNDKIRNDDDGMKLLYNKINYVAYRKLKERILDKLLNKLFLIDTSSKGIDKGSKARIDCIKSFTQIELLRTFGLKGIAIPLAEKLHSKTESHELYSLTLLLGQLLEEHYQVWKPNRIKYLKYRAKVEQCIQEMQQLRMVTETWAELANLLLVFKGNKQLESKVEVSKNLEKLKQIAETNSTFSFNFKYYSSLIFFFWLNKDFQNQLEASSKAILVLEKFKKSFPIPVITVTTYKAIAELNLKKYKESEETLNAILIEFPITPGRQHWLNIYNYLFLIKTINKQYRASTQIVAEVTNLKNFKKLDEKWLQPWLIKEAYINILIRIGKINEDDLKGVKLRPFRLTTFMNNVPLYFKDKRGTNIAILIAQFIYLLAENKQNQLFAKLDGLNQYCHRYLRNDETYRSNCFIKMLMKIPNASFHPIAVRRHTDDLWKKLQAAPMTISEQSYEVEIIPYEDLWEIVLEILDTKKG